MKTHIKTTRKNYILNASISGAIALYVGMWLPFKFSGGIIQWWFILPTILIFHHFFRAGEYILTGKTITISPRLIDGYEEKGRGIFIYYLTTATLMSLFIIYLTYFNN